MKLYEQIRNSHPTDLSGDSSTYAGINGVEHVGAIFDDPIDGADVTEVIVRRLRECDHGTPFTWTYTKDGHKVEHVDPAEVEALKAQVAKLEADNRTIAAQTRATCESEFVQHVMDYHEGCDSGKVEFLESCGYSVPTMTVRVTVDYEVNIGTDISEIESDVRSALEYRGDYTPYNIDAEEY